MAEPEVGFICPECPGRPMLGSEAKLREHWEALHQPDSSTVFEMEQKSGHDFQASGWKATPSTCQVCNTLAWNLCCVCAKCQFVCHRKCLDALKDAAKDKFCPGFRQRTNTVIKTLRRLVSGVKKRYVSPFVDIDLTYITPRVIAMSYPATGLEATYRNKMDDVAQLLHARHGEHYMIFNVSERCYDTTKFANQVLDFGWDDHLAPTLERLTSVCRSMDSWLRVDARNAVVVHCKGGKGRTGVVIASFFLFAGLFVKAEDALREFAARRFGHKPGARVGVTQPSQRRFVHYFAQTVTRSLDVMPRRLQITGIYFRGDVPNYDGHGGSRPIVQVFHALSQKIFESSETPSYTFRDPYFSFPLDCVVAIEGDVLIRCLHRTTNGKDHEIFRCQFHTFFVTTKSVTFHKRDLDSAHKDKRFPPSATFSLVFDERDLAQSSSPSHAAMPFDSIRPEEPTLDARHRSASTGHLAPHTPHTASGTRLAPPTASPYAASDGGSGADDLYDDDDDDDDASESDGGGGATGTAMSQEAALYFDALRVSSPSTAAASPYLPAASAPSAAVAATTTAASSHDATVSALARVKGVAPPLLLAASPAAAILGLGSPLALTAAASPSPSPAPWPGAHPAASPASASLSTTGSGSGGGGGGSFNWHRSESVPVTAATATATHAATPAISVGFAVWPESPEAQPSAATPGSGPRTAATVPSIAITTASSTPASAIPLNMQRGLSTPDVSTVSSSPRSSRAEGDDEHTVLRRQSQTSLDSPARWSLPSELPARLRSDSSRSVSSLPATVPLTLGAPPHPWYLGTMSMTAAERVLRDKFEQGDFLVRRDGPAWAVAVLGPHRIVEHFNIMWCEPGFALTTQPRSIFPSIPDLIEHYRKEPITTNLEGAVVVLQRGVGVAGLPVGVPEGAEPPRRTVTPVDRRAALREDP